MKGDLTSALSWLASERAVKELLAAQLKETEARAEMILAGRLPFRSTCHKKVSPRCGARAAGSLIHLN